MKKQLEIGYDYPVFVREEQLFNSDFESLRIMYLSDFHFNKFNGNLVLKIIKIIQQYEPTILLLGGDYADTKGGFSHFIRLLYALSERNNVFAVAGNHDYWYGIETIKKAIQANNINWIEKTTVVVSIDCKTIQIDGNTLTRNEIKPDDLKILCLHKPINISLVAKYYHFAFAGHLHGSQWVLWQNEKGLYPGRFFYRWNILKERIENCHYYISRGLGDTLPIRFNCNREIVIVNIL